MRGTYGAAHSTVPPSVEPRNVRWKIFNVMVSVYLPCDISISKTGDCGGLTLHGAGSTGSNTPIEERQRSLRQRSLGSRLRQSVDALRPGRRSSSRPMVGGEGTGLLQERSQDHVTHASDEATSPRVVAAIVSDRRSAPADPGPSRRPVDATAVPKKSNLREAGKAASGLHVKLDPPATESKFGALCKALELTNNDVAAIRTEFSEIRPLLEQHARTALTEDGALKLFREHEAQPPNSAPMQEQEMLRSDPPVQAPISLWKSGRRMEIAEADLRACSAKVCEDTCTGGNSLPVALFAGLGYAGYDALTTRHSFNMAPALFGLSVTTATWCGGTFAKAVVPIHDRASGTRFAREAQDPSLPYLAARRELAARFGSTWLKTYEDWARTPESCTLTYAWELAKSSKEELEGGNIPMRVLDDLTVLREIRKSDTIPETLKDLDKLCRANPKPEKMSISKMADTHITEIAPTCGSLFLHGSKPALVSTNIPSTPATSVNIV